MPGANKSTLKGRYGGMRVVLKGMKGSQKYVAGSQMFWEQHFSWVSATVDEKASEGVKKKNRSWWYLLPRWHFDVKSFVKMCEDFEWVTGSFELELSGNMQTKCASASEKADTFKWCLKSTFFCVCVWGGWDPNLLCSVWILILVPRK